MKQFFLTHVQDIADKLRLRFKGHAVVVLFSKRRQYGYTEAARMITEEVKQVDRLSALVGRPAAEKVYKQLVYEAICQARMSNHDYIMHWLRRICDMELVGLKFAV